MFTQNKQNGNAGKLDKIELKNYKSTLKWWNYVRWFSTISFLSIGIIQISLSGLTFPIHAFILTLSAITLLNITYSLWIETYSDNFIFPFIHNFLDIIIMSLAIFMTGGKNSPFLWGYLIPILTSSITLGRFAGFITSILSITGLLIISYLSNLSVVTALKETYNAVNVIKLDTRTILSFTCLFFLVYFISSFLANTLRSQNKNLKSLNQELEKKNYLILESQEKLVEMQQNETVYQMALTMQHEINNPLAILSLQSEMLSKENDNNSRVKSMNDSILRIKTILDKIKLLHSKTLLTRNALDDMKIIDINKSSLTTGSL